MPLDLIRRYRNKVSCQANCGNLNGYTPCLDQRKLVPTHRFDGKDWIECDMGAELAGTDGAIKSDNPTKIQHLSFYSQNIWFGKKNMEERYKTLIQMI
jgi:hypothetical protein